ncbi:hypothetical protein Ga0100231_005120 [Opitutaceae bacterium TAV4]|nr:hypothetical protein Ga0100231_005120 [Opitutaceae bacterium TAV4]RRK00909.1 hypothetical protein Ga0100230_024365 [Opitutaceae bacterium TAV3]
MKTIAPRGSVPPEHNKASPLASSGHPANFNPIQNTKKPKKKTNTKERVLFLLDENVSFSPFAMNQPDIGNYIDVEMDGLADGESITFTISRKDMTKAELAALPEA